MHVPLIYLRERNSLGTGCHRSVNKISSWSEGSFEKQNLFGCASIFEQTAHAHDFKSAQINAAKLTVMF